MKKVLGNAAVLAALVLFAGACSTAPKEETEFLSAVKGKTITMNGATEKVSADGKTIGEGANTITFSKAESALKASYVSSVVPKSVWAFSLNEDKKGGKTTVTAEGVPVLEFNFTIQ